MDRVCFDRPTFSMYMFILVCTMAYLIYFAFGKEIKTFVSGDKNIDIYSSMDKDTLYKTIINMKDQLFTSKLNEQKYQTSLQQTQLQSQQPQQPQQTNNIQSRMLDKIYNPLVSPETIYASGRINSQGFDGYNQYQMLGYFSGQIGEQFPVFGRYKYPGKTDKYEYYTINEGRGRIKIPFKTKNYNELYDGDKVSIPQIGSDDLIFTKYEIENQRYNPNI